MSYNFRLNGDEIPDVVLSDEIGEILSVMQGGAVLFAGLRNQSRRIDTEEVKTAHFGLSGFLADLERSRGQDLDRPVELARSQWLVTWRELATQVRALLLFMVDNVSPESDEAFLVTHEEAAKGSLAPLRDGGQKESTGSAQEGGKNGAAVGRSTRPRDIAGFALSATKDGPPFVVVGEMIAQLLMSADIGVSFFSGRMPKFVPISDVSDEHLTMAAFVSQARERLDASPEPFHPPHVAGAGGITFMDILRTVEDLLAQITDNIDPDDDEGGLWVSRVVSH